MSASKVSYHVICHESEEDDVPDLWQNASVIELEDYPIVQAQEHVEPLVIFKLLTAFVTCLSIICQPQETYEDVLEEEVIIEQNVFWQQAYEQITEVHCDQFSKVNNLAIHSCPSTIPKEKEKQEIEINIRPVVRLFKKNSASPPCKKQDSPPLIRKQRPRVETAEEVPMSYQRRRRVTFPQPPKQSITFSTTTALYKPPAPSIAAYKVTEEPRRQITMGKSTLINTQTRRARTEFQERSSPIYRGISVSLFS